TKIQPSVPSNLIPLGNSVLTIMRTPFAYEASVRNFPCTSHNPFVGNSAQPRTLDRPGVLGVHGPVSRITVVRPPAGDHPGAKLFAAQPARPAIVGLRMHSLFGVVNIGSRTE